MSRELPGIRLVGCLVSLLAIATHGHAVMPWLQVCSIWQAPDSRRDRKISEVYGPQHAQRLGRSFNATAGCSSANISFRLRRMLRVFLSEELCGCFASTESKAVRRRQKFTHRKRRQQLANIARPTPHALHARGLEVVDSSYAIDPHPGSGPPFDEWL